MQFLQKTNKFLSVYRDASNPDNLLRRNLNPKSVIHHGYSARRFPDLLYVPHIFRWIVAKIKLKYLKKTWDPDFSEGAFIYGTTAAICRITEIINLDHPNRLGCLLTPIAASRLRIYMEYRLTKTQKSLIKLKPGDIKLFVPVRVQLVRDKDNNRRCLVLLKSLAMKWYEEHNSLKLVLVVLQTEFKRDYSEGAKPEWIISLFDIVQCILIGSNTAVS